MEMSSISPMNQLQHQFFFKTPTTFMNNAVFDAKAIGKLTSAGSCEMKDFTQAQSD